MKPSMYTPGLLSLKKSNVDVVGFDPRVPLMAVVEGGGFSLNGIPNRLWNTPQRALSWGVDTSHACSSSEPGKFVLTWYFDRWQQTAMFQKSWFSHVIACSWLQHYTAGEIQWQEISIPGQEDSITHFCPCSPTAVIIAITAWKIQFDWVSPQSSSFSWINWHLIKIISGKLSIKFKTDVNDFFVHQVTVQSSSAKPTQITEHNMKKGIGSSRSGRYTHKLF